LRLAETSDMAISINPVLPVLAAQEVGGTAPELVLQPGSVVNAQVFKVLSADLVRIAISSLSIDVLSDSAAGRPGLAACGVATKDGIRLAVVGLGGDAPAHRPCRHAVAGGTGRYGGPDDCRAENIDAAGTCGGVSRSAKRGDGAGGLAPLFANLGAVA
jgi:hypothetical protein